MIERKSKWLLWRGTIEFIFRTKLRLAAILGFILVFIVISFCSAFLVCLKSQVKLLFILDYFSRYFGFHVRFIWNSILGLFYIEI